MKRKFLTLLLTLGFLGSAHAQFGGMLGGMLGGARGGGGSDVGALVDEFNRDSLLIREAVSRSLMQIVAALGNKEQIAKVKATNDSLSKNTDAKEVGSIQGTFIKDQSAVAQQLMDSADAKEKMEKLAPEIQKKVGQSILNVAIAGLRIPVMLERGKRAIDGVSSNPMMITRILPIKDGVSLFVETLPKMTQIASTGFNLMREVKIDPGSPTASSKIETVEVAFGDDA